MTEKRKAVMVEEERRASVIPERGRSLQNKPQRGRLGEGPGGGNQESWRSFGQTRARG